ncbi:MAG: tyrosine-type recombinase/integrase [Anaerostipes sp.]|jgi:integrase|nr:tyrosine-type recombinase/integrase [Anaerostipes sp.]
MSVQKKSYRKKDGSITTRYYASVYDGRTKKRIVGPLQEKRINASKDEIEIMEELKNGKEKEKIAKERGMLFGEVADQWLAYSKGFYRNSTLVTYEYYYNRYIKEVFENVGIRKIESSHILKFKTLMQETTNKNGKPYSPETINKMINILCDIFNFASDELKVIEPNKNPMLGIKRNHVPYKKKITWTNEQIQAFLNSPIVKESHYYAMFATSLLVGTRPGETCGLAETDLNKELHTLELNRGIDKQGNFTDLKTPASHRSIYLPDALYDLIKSSLTWKKKIQLQYPDFFTTDTLFVTEEGGAVTPNHYSKMFRRTIERYSQSVKPKDRIPQIPLYNCRHTFGTNNYSRGVQDKIISSIMGNDVKTFLHNYAHIRGSEEKKTISDFADIIFSDETAL